MGLIDPGSVSTHPSATPTTDAAPRWRPPQIPQRPTPEKEHDWRAEELRGLRAAICRHAPPPDDIYWTDNQVWVGCVSADMDKSTGTGDFVRLTFKAVTVEDTDDIWQYYEANKSKIISEIRAQVPAGNIRLRDVKVEKGSVTFLILLQVTIGLALLVFAVLGNYDNIERNFKRAMPLIKQYAADTVESIKGFFRGFRSGFA